jgi:hypothetical protein
MPDLHQLLTEAVPLVEPGFGEAEVRARMDRLARRGRRIVATAASAVGLVLVGLVASLTAVDAPAPLLDGGLQREWPDSVEFLGVQIAVDVMAAPTEPLEHRVLMGAGTAALTTQPSDELQPGNTTWQRFQHRLWFSCGDGQVVRMVEMGRAAEAPTFTVAGPSGRWLPAGALIEAGRRTAADVGCVPSAPTGAPVQVENAQSWVGSLAAAMEEAGMASCCANPNADPTNDWFLNDWGVAVEGEDRLSLSVGRRGSAPFAGDQPVQVTPMAGGHALLWIAPDTPADVVELECGDAHILAYPTSGRATSVERFVERIGCTPTVPAGVRAVATPAQEEE